MTTKINIREKNKSFLENFLRTQRAGISWAGEFPKIIIGNDEGSNIPDVIVTSSSPSKGYIGSYEESMNAIKGLPQDVMILNRPLEKGLEMDLRYLATSEKINHQEYQKIASKYRGQI